MTITTRDGLIAALAASKRVPFYKQTTTTMAGRVSSLFRANGVPVGGTAPASTGVALSRSSQGALVVPAPSGVSYLSSFEALCSVQNGLLVADRLVEFGGLSGIVTSAQTVSALALPSRATSALDVELWLEVYTALGSTASASVTASYTNQAGTAGRTATLNNGFPSGGIAANTAWQMTLQAGDTGVQSVQSVTIGTSTGTAGNFGAVLRRTLVSGLLAGSGSSYGFSLGYPETDLEIVPDDACLELLVFASGTLSGMMLGNVGVSQG